MTTEHPAKPGAKFLHARVINPDTKAPARCEVTAVRLDCVHYKHEGETRGRAYFPMDQTHKYVKVWL